MKKRMLIILMSLAILILNADMISLDQARALALENNSEYQQKKAELEAATWARRAALGSMLPTLSLSGSYIYMDPATTVGAGASSFTLNNDLRSVSLNLSQPLFMGGKLWQAYKISQISEEMAQQSLQNQELKLLAEVEEKFLSVLLLQNLHELSGIQMNAAVENLEKAEARLRSGLISEADFTLFQAEHASIEVSWIQSEAALQLAQLDLANYLNVDFFPEPVSLRVSKEDRLLKYMQLDVGAAHAFIEGANEYARLHNPSFKILEANTELSKRGYSIAKNNFLPSLILTGSRKFDENGIDRYKFSGQNQILLTASLPLLPQITNYANSRKAYHEMRSAAYAIQSAEAGIKTAMQAAVLNLFSSARQLKATTLSAQYARTSYQQMEYRYGMNLVSALDLINAELRLYAAESALLNAEHNWWKSQSKLMQLLGSTDKDVIYTVFEQGLRANTLRSGSVNDEPNRRNPDRSMEE